MSSNDHNQGVAPAMPKHLPRKPSIGKSVAVRGELSGDEDLNVEGSVEGRISLPEHVLTVGPDSRIRAEVFAKSVIVLGEITGNVTASERVDIRDGGSLDGDITAPRVSISEGAHFRGAIDMNRPTVRQFRTASPVQFWVEFYIPAADPVRDYKTLEAIQRAVGHLLQSFGYEPEPESVSLTHASWNWKELFRRNGPVHQEATEVYDEIKEALRRQQIDIAGAEAFEKRAKASADLLRALEGYDSAVARIGDVIIAKAVLNGKPRVAIETLSPALARKLEQNPALMRNPDAFFALLDDGDGEPRSA